MHSSTVASALANLPANTITWFHPTTAPALTLRRAWPRGHDHMLAEFNTPEGGIVAGQWFANSARGNDVLADLRRIFPAARLGAAFIEGGLLTLQGDGADDKMPSLASWVSHPESTLLVHRPTRRAVLRTTFRGETAFVKVVPAKVHTTMLESALRVQRLACTEFAVPTLLHHECSRDGGVIVWSQLQGISVHDLFTTPAFVRASRAAGRGLAALHHLHAALSLPRFKAQDAIAELHRWADRTSDFDTGLADLVRAHLAKPARDLSTTPEPPLTLIHRDFHDKQIFMADCGKPGLLDFDTLSVGDPALDVGNLLAHVELRREQGRLSADGAQDVRNAFLNAYAPSAAVLQRSRFYETLTLLRLACVYAFRTHGRSTSMSLMRSAISTNMQHTSGTLSR